jgi:hypothetical protein
MASIFPKQQRTKQQHIFTLLKMPSLSSQQSFNLLPHPSFSEKTVAATHIFW